MFSKSSMSLLAAVALMGCGGPVENEEQGQAPAPVNEGSAQSGGDEGPIVHAQTVITIPPGSRGEFPSYWPGSTHIQLNGYTSQFAGTNVHMYCTTGSNDITVWIAPNSYPQWEWWCYGRTIFVTNQGTDGTTQTIQGTTW